ncbi:UBX domain-containing protein [Sergentomyia squamirostris]
MNWFKGDIAEAVAQSKKSNAIFVVFVTGTDELSTKLGSLIDNEIIRKYLEGKSFVSIRIDSGSESYTQFAQIYQVVPLPSLFFIGQNGTPVEVVTGLTTTAEELKQKIRGVLDRVGLSSDSSSASSEATGSKTTEDKSPKEETSSAPRVECVGDVCRRVDEGESNSSAPDRADEKVARAKELIEKKRKEKEAEEALEEKEKELQRRRQGQDVASLKKWQEDQELKQLKEDRMKEKKEAQEARKKILEQIEQDKRERAQRFAPTTSPVAPAEEQISPPISNSDSSRIQFKTPSGDTEVHVFASSDPFVTVRNYVRTEILGGSGVTDFTLATTFPRREFSQENDSETLSELRLTPSAVLLIIPRGRGRTTGSVISSQVAPTTPSGGTIFHFITSLLWSFITPVMSALSYMRNWAFPRPDSGQQKRASEDQISDHDSAKRRNLNIPSSSGSDSGSSQSSSSKSAEAAYRRLGSSNIHRLHDRRDSDDENNTWNGNSTQQM